MKHYHLEHKGERRGTLSSAVDLDAIVAIKDLAGTARVLLRGGHVLKVSHPNAVAELWIAWQERQRELDGQRELSFLLAERVDCRHQIAELYASGHDCGPAERWLAKVQNRIRELTT